MKYLKLKSFFLFWNPSIFLFPVRKQTILTWSLAKKKIPVFLISLKFSICWPGLPANKDPCLCPPPSHFCSGWDVAGWKLSGQWSPRREIHSGPKRIIWKWSLLRVTACTLTTNWLWQIKCGWPFSEWVIYFCVLVAACSTQWYSSSSLMASILRDNASWLLSGFRWSWVLIDMLSSLSAVFCTFLWTWEMCCHCLFKAAVSSRLGLGANPSWEEMLALLVWEMRDLLRKGTGKLILPLHLTLGVTNCHKWSPDQCTAKLEAPRDADKSEECSPATERTALHWLQEAGLYPVLLPRGCHSMPCWRTDSF